MNKNTEKSYVLSFDIGIRNLAYCVIDVTKKHPCIWEVCDILQGSKKATFEQTVEMLIHHLNDICATIADVVESGSIVRVVIENQPAFKNPTMKSIQIVIYTYFKMRYDLLWDVHLIAASAKNMYMKEKGFVFSPKDYKSVKAASVNCTKTIIEDEDALSKIAEHKKKDDLCDCFLQALAFLSR
jgi:Poxvirus A22 protein